MVTDAQRRLSALLADVSGEDAGFEARQIIKEYCGGGPLKENSEEWRKCLDAADRRKNGEPLQYIFGHWEFYGLDFKVGSGVLIPRQDTETVAELVIDRLKAVGGRFADLCAGSGCIGIAAAKYTGCNGVEIEISSDAAKYCADNIALHALSDKLTLIKGDIFDRAVRDMIPDGSLSVIVSNPPYISEADMRQLQREVRSEPELALYGGKDGLDFYRRLFTEWKAKLTPNGLFAVECGDGESNAVCALMQKAGFSPKVYNDLAGLPRAVCGEKTL